MMPEDQNINVDYADIEQKMLLELKPVPEQTAKEISKQWWKKFSEYGVLLHGARGTGKTLALKEYLKTFKPLLDKHPDDMTDREKQCLLLWKDDSNYEVSFNVRNGHYIVYRVKK